MSITWGCATGARKTEKGPVMVESSHKSAPEWIARIPQDKEFYYFVGTSEDVQSFDSGKKQAIHDALSQVVSAIGIRVTASSTYEEKYFARTLTTEVSQELYTEGEAKLHDAELEEIYYQKFRNPDGSSFFRVWCLLKYSRKQVREEQQRLEAILELKYGEVRRLEEKAARLEDQGRLSRALVTYLQAAASAVELEEAGEVFFQRNMNRALGIAMGISLEKSGEDQTGYVGRPLSQPLELKVHCTRQGEVEPMDQVPVKFLYRVPRTESEGYKYLVYNKITDSRGTARLTIEKVYQVSEDNRVEAKIDPRLYVAPVQNVQGKYSDRVNTLEDVLQTKKAVFVFPSDTHARKVKTGIYFLQVDADQSLVGRPITAPVVSEILYNKRFSIRTLDIAPSRIFQKPDREIWEKLTKAASKGTQRILFGYVRIINYDKISGFHVAQAVCEASLFDRSTGEVIRTWQVRRSGTGTTREDARTSVLTEAGRSLGEIASRTMP